MNLKANYSNGSVEIGGLHFPRLWEGEINGTAEKFMRQLANENSYVIHQILFAFRDILKRFHNEISHVSEITLFVSIYQSNYFIYCEKSSINNFAWRITNISSVVQPSGLQITDVTRTTIIRPIPDEKPVEEKKSSLEPVTEIYWEDLEGVVPVDYQTWSEEGIPGSKLSRFIHNFANKWI